MSVTIYIGCDYNSTEQRNPISTQFPISDCHFARFQNDGTVWHREDEFLKRPISITAEGQLSEGCEYCIHPYIH